MSVLFPGVQITLDKPRTVRFDFNSNVKLEKETGVNTLMENPIDKEHMNGTMLRAMLWAGLLHEDKTLTIEQAGAMITSRNSNAVLVAVIDAWTETLPEAKESKQGGQAEETGKAEKPADPPNPAQS
jgi:hypothetical protein